MGDKVRGTIAILAGVFALVRGAMGFMHGEGPWKTWGLLVAGLVVIGLGVWRFRRRPDDPAEELLR